MAKINIKFKINIKLIAIILVIIAISLGVTFSILNITNAKKEKKQLLSDIEYTYYYFKKEPVNLRLFSVINKDDGVALSAWQNHLSTSENELKKISNLLLEDKEIIKKFSEFKETDIFDKLQETLNKYKEIIEETKKRVSGNTSFSEDKLKSLENELNNNLSEIKEEAKSLNLDLR